MEAAPQQEQPKPQTHEQWLRQNAEERLKKLESGETSREQYLRDEVENIKRLENLAEHDPLTDLLNRRGMERYAKNAIAEARRLGQDVAVILLDLDRFKSVNDTHGHDAGDRVLVQAASILSKHGVAARWGGEELLVLLVGGKATDLEEEVSQMGRSIRQQTIVTASIGGVISQGNESFGTLVSRADMLAYKAKNADAAGENRNRGFVEGSRGEPIKILFG